MTGKQRFMLKIILLIMKLRSFISFIFVFCGSIYSIHAQSEVPQVEKVDLYVSELIIKDSLFLHGLDSFIFNSICPDTKNPNEKANVFNIISKKQDKHAENYKFICTLQYGIQIYEKLKLRGCFEYKDYLFLWFDDIPKELISISNEKKRLSYMTGVPPIVSDLATFTFNYTIGCLILTGICCY